MEGVVDHHLRHLFNAIGGIDVCVTEFVRITQTVLPQKVFRRYCPELLTPLSIPVRVQLLGSDPEMMALNARKVADMGAAAIDLNFGCPAKTVNKNRGGACLLQDTELLYHLVKAVRDAVPAPTPVTAKIRLGYQSRSRYVENAQAICAAGAQEIVVHARSKEDRYNPPAYWHCIDEIRQAVPIPVVANGEIWSLQDFLQCREESGCSDIMLGRGLLAKPDLAREIKAHQAGDQWQSMGWQQLLPLIYRYHHETIVSYPAKYCGNRLKQWLVYLRRQYPEAAVMFERIKTLRDQSALEQVLQEAMREPAV